MHSAVKVLIGVVIGAAAGGACSYFYLDKKYEKLLEKEIDDIRGHYRERMARIIAASERSELAKKGVTDHHDPAELSKADYNKSVNEHGMTDYTRFAYPKDIPVDGASAESFEAIKDELENLNKDIRDEGLDRHMAEREHPEDDDPEEMTPEEEEELDGYLNTKAVTEEQLQAIREGRKPYHIPIEEFLEGKDWYTKVDATWYQDGILTDSDDEPIECHERCVGTEFVDWFGSEGDPDVVHVRNDCTQEDFEICRAGEPYYPQVEKPLRDGQKIVLSSE